MRGPTGTPASTPAQRQPTPSATTPSALSSASRNSASVRATTRECGFAQANTKQRSLDAMAFSAADTSSGKERVPTRTPSNLSLPTRYPCNESVMTVLYTSRPDRAFGLPTATLYIVRYCIRLLQAHRGVVLSRLVRLADTGDIVLARRAA